ncbi:MAG: MBL fold metallo-hydrolase [Hymenobacteraceae bacterium]|nr:MBL fold metallo-hydrolase [Hymenobacteraceae bacterium]
MSFQIERFYDKGLAHASYAVVSGREAALIDPARDPQPYLDFLADYGARLVAVVETHPHADFVSAHAELALTTGAPVYVSPRVGATYPHQAFAEAGAVIRVGTVTLRSLDTPGHSPDSICVVLDDEAGVPQAVFTGDTLFVGATGRPDLREDLPATDAASGRPARDILAEQLFASLHRKLLPLPAATRVLPAHGPGSLCGKAVSGELESTIGTEAATNAALQTRERATFVRELLADQPFVPKYFGASVQLNKAGAPPLAAALAPVPRVSSDAALTHGVLVVDTRPAADFRAGHLPGALNLPDGGKFETWLGSVVGPAEAYYLIAADEAAADTVLRKAAKIGYEAHVRGLLTTPPAARLTATGTLADANAVRADSGGYTVVDVRNDNEFAQKLFPNAIEIPLHQLRERLTEIPTDKPLLVHCAGGYRSAAGASILSAAFPGVRVEDLSEAVTTFAVLVDVA